MIVFIWREIITFGGENNPPESHYEKFTLVKKKGRGRHKLT